MQTSTPLESLHHIGLSKDQSAVYLYLLQNGMLSAAMLSKRLGITRTLVYKILDDLEKLQIVTKDDLFKVTRFKAEHPYTLRKIGERKKIEAEELSQRIETSIFPLISEFNLQSSKPAVHFMEGLAGVSQTLEDSLTAQETIYSYVDSETLDSEVLDIDEQYVKKRLKKGIAKKILMAKTDQSAEYARNNQSELTQIRLIESENIPHFFSVMYMYDKKVSYITYKDSTFSSVLMHDASIYTMQRFVFEAMWRCAEIL